MLLSAVSVLVVAQSSSEFREGLMNNPVHYTVSVKHHNLLIFKIDFRAHLTLKILSCLIQCNVYVHLAVAQWLRCCATNRNVAGSITDGVIGIFH